MISWHDWFSLTSQGQSEDACWVPPHDSSYWIEKWPVLSPRWCHEGPPFTCFLSTAINVWWVNLNNRWSTWTLLNTFAWWELFWHWPLWLRCKRDTTSQTTCWSMHELLFMPMLWRSNKKWKKWVECLFHDRVCLTISWDDWKLFGIHPFIHSPIHPSPFEELDKTSRFDATYTKNVFFSRKRRRRRWDTRLGITPAVQHQSLQGSCIVKSSAWWCVKAPTAACTFGGTNQYVPVRTWNRKWKIIQWGGKQLESASSCRPAV